MAAEMAMQRSRLEAVEQAQQAQQRAPAVAPTHASSTTDGASIPAQLVAAAIGNPADERAAAASRAPSGVEHEQKGSAPTVHAILRRLSLLESRVGTQLQQIEAVCTDTAAAGSPRSAPVSPLKSGPWGGGPTHPQQQPQQQQHKHTPSRASRAVQAAAVAAAAVYGTSTQGTECSVEEAGDGVKWAAAGMGQVGYQQQGTWDYEAALPGSPRIMASGMARPASAAAGYFCSGGLSAGGRQSPTGYKGTSGTGGGSASKRSRAVELQVAETHGLIAGIQTQIAAIKNSLAHASGELDARRQEASYNTQRLDQLERTDRHMVEASNLCGAVSLERRVRSLEEQVASASRQAAAGGALARETSAALRGLEWRVDKSAGATIGTIKALEARQDRARSELHSVAATATLAEAKGATEVARLQRRIHGGGLLLGGGGGGGRAGPYRMY